MLNSNETRLIQTEPKMTRRDFLRMIALAAAGGTMSACLGKSEQPTQSQETLSSYDELLIQLAEGEPKNIVVATNEGWHSILLRLGLTNFEIGSKLVGNVKRATVSQEAGKLNLRRVFEDKENPYLSYDETTTLRAALQNSDMPPRPGEKLTLSASSEMKIADYDAEMASSTEPEAASPTEPD